MTGSSTDQARAIEIARAEERERRRIARGLHDQVGRLLAEAMQELERSDSRPRSPHLRSLIQEALKATRSLTFDLGLPPIGDHGLGGVLETICRAADARGELEVVFEENGTPGDLSDGVVLVLSQVVRELLHNIVKHARASAAAVIVDHTPEHLQITVTDNGIGLSGSLEGVGFGLADSRGRLADLGGRFEFGSKDGVGTVVMLELALG